MLEEEFTADGFVELSVREYSGGQDDIRALVDFINDNVFDIGCLHESESFLGPEQASRFGAAKRANFVGS